MNRQLKPDFVLLLLAALVFTEGKHRHGLYRGHKCSRTCRLRQCNRHDGFCTFGCKDGFWKITCELACSGGCLNNVCHIVTGACLEGCLEGFAGTNCSKIQQDEGKRRRSSPGISEFYPVIIEFIVIMCFSTICFLFNKTDNWKKIIDFCTQRIVYKNIMQPKIGPTNGNYV